MLGLRLVGEEENGNAFSLYGPKKAGLTTTHKTQQVQLSELLNSLEREVESLNSKYCEAYVTLINVMEHLARLTSLLLPTTITDIE
jgi:DNA integrity scanning protein DisA with diadenylate cyclase activity